MDEIDPADLARALYEVPLFREIQTVLAGQRGMVNWVIASQVARAVGGAGGESAPDERDELAEACRVAELQLTSHMGLDPPATLVEVEVFERRAWADRTLEELKPWVERFARRLQLSAGPMELPEMSFTPLMNSAGGFLIGIQMGFLAGMLARTVFARYDLCMPQGPPDRLVFVQPNITLLRDQLGVDAKQFNLWIAFHEVAYNLHLDSVKWARGHYQQLVESYIDSTELDASEIVTKLRDLTEPEQLERVMSRPDELLPMVSGPEQEAAMSRIRVFVSLLNGHVTHMMRSTAAELIPEFAKITEGMTRRRVERGSAERLLEKLLGLEVGTEHNRVAASFIEKVEEAKLLEDLWARHETLPTQEELEEPGLWIKKRFSA